MSTRTRIISRETVRAAVRAGQDVTALAPTAVLTHAELHLGSSPIPSGLASRIRAAGGKYSECRGYDTARFVTLPVKAGWEALAIECVTTLGSGARGSIVIFRGIEDAGSHPKLSGMGADDLTAATDRAWEHAAQEGLTKTQYDGSGASRYVRAEDVLAVAAEEHARMLVSQRAMIEGLRASLVAAEAELVRLEGLGHAMAVAS
jgi:hypothetical protein